MWRALGGATPLVTSTRWDWGGQASPGGERLAFVSNRGGAPELWSAAIDGSDPRMLTTLNAGIVAPPAWSPDGSTIVVAAPSAGSIDILRLDPRSGGVEGLVTDASDERDPVFSADGRYLLFASNRGGEWDIWRLHLAGGEVERWTEGGGAVARPDPDGVTVWHIRPDRPGLWRKRSIGAPAELVDEHFRPAGPSDWLAREDGIYYLRYDDNFDAWLARFNPSTGGHEDLLALEDGSNTREIFPGAGLWIAPDGSRALFSSIDLSHSDLWIRRGRPADHAAR